MPASTTRKTVGEYLARHRRATAAAVASSKPAAAQDGDGTAASAPVDLRGENPPRQNVSELPELPDGEIEHRDPLDWKDACPFVVAGPARPARRPPRKKSRIFEDPDDGEEVEDVEEEGEEDDDVVWVPNTPDHGRAKKGRVFEDLDDSESVVFETDAEFGSYDVGYSQYEDEDEDNESSFALSVSDADNYKKKMARRAARIYRNEKTAERFVAEPVTWEEEMDEETRHIRARAKQPAAAAPARKRTSVKKNPVATAAAPARKRTRAKGKIAAAAAAPRSRKRKRGSVTGVQMMMQNILQMGTIMQHCSERLDELSKKVNKEKE